MTKHSKTRCPACGSMIEIDEYTEVGDLITCFDCDAELEVIKLDPIKVRIAKDSFPEESETFNNIDETEDMNWDE